MVDLTAIFNGAFGEAESKHVNYGKPVEIIEFPTVHKNDNEPVNLIWPDLQRGP